MKKTNTTSEDQTTEKRFIVKLARACAKEQLLEIQKKLLIKIKPFKYTTQDYLSAITGLLVLVILFIIGWKIVEML